MTTLNLNKMIIYNKRKINTKPFVASALKKKTCLIEQFYRHCFGAAIFSKKVNFIILVSISCNNENKLKVTIQFPLAKGTFN